ncbi:ATP-binding cassette domain-containing protein [Amycolatopsis sp. NPDC051071]|uniref:ATP-binding cassette domain-containing protein n=1 Tax=Amycolatopsis sp. NPDC051071 TaxID=3154637 RepID=UPI0034447B85
MLKVRGLTKTFRSRRNTVEAVRGVDIDVDDGELIGFLGPNGAGKSTSIRMLSTLLRPTAGEAVVGGCDLLADPMGVRRRIGYVGQGNGAGLNQRVGEELESHAGLYDIGRREARRRVGDLLDRYELGGMAGRKVSTLSGGQRRRLDIVMGVLHQPSLVFLDEPSAALDPQSRSNLWDHIRSLNREQGVTVFLTTHYLDEADALCERILVIDGGKIIDEGTPDGLKRKVAGDLVTIASTEPAAAAEVAARFPGAGDVAVDETTASFRLRGSHGDQAVPDLVRALDDVGVPVSSVRTERPTLDDVFLSLTGRTLRDDSGDQTKEETA